MENAPRRSGKTRTAIFSFPNQGVELDREEELGAMFSTIGRSFGYRNVEAEFSPYKEFKTTWRRSGADAKFQVSDYLEGADRAVIEDFTTSLFSRIANKRSGELYTDRVRSWLLSQEFLRKNQPIYLDRSRNISRSRVGSTYDLSEAYQRLTDIGLVDGPCDAVISWTIKGNRMRVGYCSVLMKVVAISSILDRPNVPQHVHDYVLYHEMLHLEDGLRPGGRYHDADFRRREKLHPKWRESEQCLKRLAGGRSPC